ncbi:fibronectin type III domain-containing protein [Paenibacillus polymyxa]|uniref:RCC1 domain-containing protein n=1 Tax=Paenibacillus polymyxa TaxID=1406 RepID=UPI0032AF6874
MKKAFNTKIFMVKLFLFFLLFFSMCSSHYISAEADFERLPTNVSIGGTHVLLVDHKGKVWAWGKSTKGQLGLGNTSDAYGPTLIPTLSNINSVVAGKEFSLALDQNGEVWSWGDNATGQLGMSTYANRTVPVKIPGLKNVVEIAAGNEHSMALKSDGSVWVWGSNVSGQLGLPAELDETPTPLKNDNLILIKKIAANGDNSLALRDDDKLFSWGSNGFGQLGDGTQSTRYSPVQVKGVNQISKIYQGMYHTAVITSDGSVWTWGAGFTGALGHNKNFLLPNKVDDIGHVKQLALTGSSTLALKEEGTVWGWGASAFGELAKEKNRTEDQMAAITQIKELDNIQSIYSQESTAMAFNKQGELYSWGSNKNLRLGIYSSELKTPQLINPIEIFSAKEIPLPPQNFRLERIDEHKIRVKWDAPQNAELISGYDIFVDDFFIDTENNTTFTKELNIDKVSGYTITVSSRNTAGERSEPTKGITIRPYSSLKYIYDAAGRLEYIEKGGKQILRYEYDNNGNLLRSIKMNP